MSASTTHDSPAPAHGGSGRAWTIAALALFAAVAGAEAWFGLWMSARGFLWPDAASRATSALLATQGRDPHLAAIGFVWMPLPTLLMVPFGPLYALWPNIIASGVPTTLPTAVAAGLGSAGLLVGARRFGLGMSRSLLICAIVAASPMLFLFGSNGMSEGVAGPALTLATLSVLLYWHSGRREYVVVSAVASAVAVCCVYQAFVYSAVLLLCILAGAPLGPEAGTPRRWAAGTLALTYALPAVAVAGVWVLANWTIQGDPLFFLTSAYSNEGQTTKVGASQALRVASSPAFGTSGDLWLSIRFAATRTVPFLIPCLMLLALRGFDRRFLRRRTLLMVALVVCVPLIFMVEQLFRGATLGYLRFFMYPLFTAAAWTVYEVGRSIRPRRALALAMTGWLLTVPATVVAMKQPAIGQKFEDSVFRGVFRGTPVGATQFPDQLAATADLAGFVKKRPGTYLVDNFVGWPVVAQVGPSALDRLVLGSDRGFLPALDDPKAHGVRYILVPDPRVVPQDAVVRLRRAVWDAAPSGFRVVKTFGATNLRPAWRVIAVSRTADDDAPAGAGN